MNLSIVKILTLISMSSTIATAQSISENNKYDSKYQVVNGHKIHYYESGNGDPVLFLHGIPMSSFAFRNIIPQVTDSTRCIALDFMGYGKSDKPKIDYSFRNQYNYLEGFIDSLQLDNITLVMTDIGGVLGTYFAKNHPKKIKGLVFMESPFADARTFHKNGGMMQHMMFWMGGKDKTGYKMIVKKNMFIKMMGKLMIRKLTDVEKESYSTPFPTEESRIPLFTLPNSFPKKGKNPQTDDMADFMNKNNDFLTQTQIPKLLLYAKPGMLVNKKVLKWVEDNISNIKTIEVGKSKHLMEEDLPVQIGQTINIWLSKI